MNKIIKQQQHQQQQKKLVSESESHGRAKSGWFQIYIAKAQTIQAIIFLFYILTVYSTQRVKWNFSFLLFSVVVVVVVGLNFKELSNSMHCILFSGSVSNSTSLIYSIAYLLLLFFLCLLCEFSSF